MISKCSARPKTTMCSCPSPQPLVPAQLEFQPQGLGGELRQRDILRHAETKSRINRSLQIWFSVSGTDATKSFILRSSIKR